MDDVEVIALEEHYWDREVAAHFTERGPEMRNASLQERLYDLGALRLREMDEAGIDFQVLSHGDSGALQWLGAASLLLVAGAPFAAGAAIRAGRD